MNTNVLGRTRSIEDLIARILADLRTEASRQFGFDIREATVGRPVKFVGSTSDEDDAYAEARLAEAFKAAGFDRVAFELEPVAAAHQYESTLQHDELILIGDFGGGTSDFSLINVGAAVRRRGRQASDLLGTAGLGLAGDAFDAQIVRHLVSPALGAGTDQRSMGRLLAVPAWPYASLERWHHLSFLKTNEVMSMLDTIKWQAVRPDMIEALIHLIKHDLGYQLHQAVQKVKCDLSAHREAKFVFTDGDLTLDAVVYRADFESWIGPDLTQIETCVDSLLQQTSVARDDVDAVFLTGGSSFVPAVRRLFVSRFGEHKIRAGNEFTSVAMGLAWKAASQCARRRIEHRADNRTRRQYIETTRRQRIRGRAPRSNRARWSPCARPGRSRPRPLPRRSRRARSATRRPPVPRPSRSPGPDRHHPACGTD